jgi:hypothetical protein
MAGAKQEKGIVCFNAADPGRRFALALGYFLAVLSGRNLKTSAYEMESDRPNLKPGSRQGQPVHPE